ncbi:hypothetical protein M0R45_010319 [Rubus argutus]|uniref:Uncharacterized protein n=1 Tax=Rubus argutus TaxID=59490 RepID=A0AAW1Y707_RUBAR
MSTGQKSEHSCASFTLRRVFKSTEDDNDGTPSSSNTVSKPRDQLGPGCSAAANTFEEETTDAHAAHVQGIPTPEIYESPKLTAIPLRKKEGSQIQLLDINFPPRIAKPAIPLQPTKRLPPILMRILSRNLHCGAQDEKKIITRIEERPALVLRLKLPQ